MTDPQQVTRRLERLVQILEAGRSVDGYKGLAALSDALAAISAVREEVEAMRAEREDLAAMMRQLIWSLKRNVPDSTLPARASTLLRQYNLQGSPLRDDDSAIRSGGR